MLRRNFLSRIALVLALSFGAQGTFATIDIITHSHSICPEHGELIHNDESVVAHAPAPDMAVVSQAASGSAVHLHDHCLFAGSVRDPAQASGAGFSAQDPFWIDHGLANPTLSGGVVSFPLYLLAPKNSPPIA